MFTGIIERTGTIMGRQSGGHDGKLAVRPGKPFDGELVHGESIAVNGCCLTLEKVENGVITFHTLAETLHCTNLGGLPIGATVNMERAMMLNGRLGGHIVSGHIDAVAKIIGAGKIEGDPEFEIELPEQLAAFVVDKGSIAVDGVSLTIQSLSNRSFSVRLIPTTMCDTALTMRRKGELVNLETDLIGKYVLRRLAMEKAPPPVTMEKLRNAGFF